MNGPVSVDFASLTADESAWFAARDEFRVLVLGKTGVGKSSLINAITNANAVVGHLAVGTTGVTCYENTLVGDDEHSPAVRVAVFDAPGFFDVEGEEPLGRERGDLGGIGDTFVLTPCMIRYVRLEFILFTQSENIASYVIH